MHVESQEQLLGITHKLKQEAPAPAELRMRAPRAIARAAKLVLEPGWPHYVAFLQAGESVGMAPPMVLEALRNSMPLLKESALVDLQRRELTGVAGQCCFAPRLIFHVLAGNLFLSGIESINQALLMGAPSLVRCSEADQQFPQAWIDALAAADASVGQAVAAAWWSRDNEALTRLACEHAECVVAFGTDESVAAVRALTPISRRFISHGSKVSFALVTRESLLPDPEGLARHLTYDFSVYDQQGCLSPRALFIERASGAEWERFCNALVAEMRSLLNRLPRQRLSLADRAALARQRQEALTDAALGCSSRLLSGPDEELVVTSRPALPFSLGCMNRFVDVRVYQDPNEVLQALTPYRRKVACLGIAGQIDEGIIESLAPSRVCAPGQMQLPPLGWTHDGRQPFRDLVEWMSYDP